MAGATGSKPTQKDAFRALLHRSFEQLDKDGNGYLSREEISHFLGITGFSQRHAKEFMNLADINGDGRINKKEFRIALRKTNPIIIEESQLRAMFKEVDKDGSGKISTRELRRILVDHGHVASMEKAKELLQKYDNNGDGELDYEEFLQLMRDKLVQM